MVPLPKPSSTRARGRVWCEVKGRAMELMTLGINSRGLQVFQLDARLTFIETEMR